MYSRDYDQAHINAGNGAAFGSGRGGDTHGSYNTSSNDHYGGDTFSGPISGGNVGGRRNNNVINNGAGSGGDDVGSMQKELEDLKAQLAAKKAAAQKQSQKAKLAQDLAALKKELEAYD